MPRRRASSPRRTPRWRRWSRAGPTGRRRTSPRPCRHADRRRGPGGRRVRDVGVQRALRPAASACRSGPPGATPPGARPELRPTRPDGGADPRHDVQPAVTCRRRRPRRRRAPRRGGPGRAGPPDGRRASRTTRSRGRRRHAVPSAPRRPARSTSTQLAAVVRTAKPSPASSAAEPRPEVGDLRRPTRRARCGPAARATRARASPFTDHCGWLARIAAAARGSGAIT